MESHEVIVVGGGPAGSTCAWRLRLSGIDVLVLDKAAFPRTKLCAGWITPQVLSDLQMDVQEYPHRFMTFKKNQKGTVTIYATGFERYGSETRSSSAMRPASPRVIYARASVRPCAALSSPRRR